MKTQAKTGITHLNSLPDEALIDVKKVAELLDASRATVYRLVEQNKDFPRPRRLGMRCTRWRVGDLRAYLNGEAA